MKTYRLWTDRPKDSVLPFTVIIDLEEGTIQELTKKESAHYRKDVQKVVPSEQWLFKLYQAIEALVKVHNELRNEVSAIYDEAEWSSHVSN